MWRHVNWKLIDNQLLHSHFKLFNESIEKVFLNPLILKLLKRVQFLKSVCVIFQHWILSYVFQRLFCHLFKANFVCLSVCLYACLSFHLSVCLSLVLDRKRFWLRWMWSLFVCLFLPSYLSLKMSVCLFVCLSVYALCLIVSLFLSFFLYLFVSICQSFYLSICLSLKQLVYFYASPSPFIFNHPKTIFTCQLEPREGGRFCSGRGPWEHVRTRPPPSASRSWRPRTTTCPTSKRRWRKPGKEPGLKLNIKRTKNLNLSNLTYPNPNDDLT